MASLQQMYDRFGSLDRARLRVLKLGQIGESPQRWKTRLLYQLGGRDAEGRPLEIEAEYDAVFVADFHVDQDNVDAVIGDEIDGGGAALRDPEHGDVGMTAEAVGQQLPDELVIVDDVDPERWR